MSEARGARGPRARLHADQDLGGHQQVKGRRRQRDRSILSPLDEVAQEDPQRERERGDEEELGRDIYEDGAHGGRTAVASRYSAHPATSMRSCDGPLSSPARFARASREPGQDQEQTG